MANANELRAALQLIKEECVSQGESCSTCPLFIEDGIHTSCGVVGCDVGIASGDFKAKPKYWELPRIKLMDAPKENK